MCRNCIHILGPYCRPHKEHECPVTQAAYCGQCGQRGHFQNACMHAPKSVPFEQKEIPSVKPPPPTLRAYPMGNTMEGYVEYIRIYGLQMTGTLDGNRNVVAEHLKTLGYELHTPCTPPPKRRILTRSK